MRKHPTALRALFLVSLGLTGCNQGGDHLALGAAGTCTPFKAADSSAPSPSNAAVADTSSAVDECLHRWGYALAPARENAEVIAAATVTACGSALSGWNQQALNQNEQQPDQATSLTTGQPTNLLAEHAQFAQSQALFYVVQARAGNCPAPPARLLVRSGT